MAYNITLRREVMMAVLQHWHCCFSPLYAYHWVGKHGSLLTSSSLDYYFTCCGKKDPNKNEFMGGYNLERFKQAQEYAYATALTEIRNGRKTSHWIWYIFPQLKGLGRSYNSEYYGIENLEEAKAYLEDETLGMRLREISQALMEHANKLSAYDILGGIDAKKVKSCMTLFDVAAPNDVFASVLDAFFDGKRDGRTIGMLS